MSKEEIRELRDDFNELKIEILDSIDSRRRDSKARRVENIHVLVALAIFGAFTSGISDQFISKQLQPIFRYIGWFSVSFLLLKLTTLSLRPILVSLNDSYLKQIVQYIDDMILPVVYIVLLYSGFSIVLIENVVDIQEILPDTGIIEALFWVEVLFLSVIGYVYGKKMGESMSLESSSNDHVLTFPSATSGSCLNFYIKNPSNKEIPSGDIEFKILAPEGVSIENVKPALESGNKWITSHDLPADERMKVTIEISTDESVLSSGEHDVEVITLFEDEVETVESLSFEV
jgi:hypothetical protein